MTNREYLERYYHGDLNDALKRLENGEPVQYIVSNINFYGYIYDINKNVLIPRFETEELVENTLKYLKKYFVNPKVLDLCTGSGCIGLTLKLQEKGIKLTLADISAKALEVAKINQQKYHIECQIIESDLFKKINDKYDVIVCNPPYISKNDKIDDIVKNNEPSVALYAKNNGLEFYERIFKECEKHLNSRYLIALEIGYMQKEEVTNLAYHYLHDIKVLALKDLNKKDRMIFVFKNIE